MDSKDLKELAKVYAETRLQLFSEECSMVDQELKKLTQEQKLIDVRTGVVLEGHTRAKKNLSEAYAAWKAFTQ